MGVNLFMNAVRLVLSNWREAVRITGALYLIYAIPALFLGLLLPSPAPGADPTAAVALAPVGIITAVLLLVVSTWLAVAWHRYILLDEAPAGQLPAWNGQRIISYMGWALLLALIMVVASVVVGIVLSPLILAGPLLAFALPIVALFVALIIDYRLGMVLPARALERPLTFAEAWEATKGQTGTIFVLAIVSAVAAVVIDLPAVVLGMFPAIGHVLAMLWTLATGWLKILVGTSILTTLYGVYIEKRQIPR